MYDQEAIEELRKIRQLLEKPAPPPLPKGLMQEFRTFLSQYKVLGLAVAFILGVYLGALVKALVTDLILPIVEIGLPANSDINTYTVSVGGVKFGVGDFANAVLTFIIVAFVIFLIVKVAKRYNIE